MDPKNKSVGYVRIPMGRMFDPSKVTARCTVLANCEYWLSGVGLIDLKENSTY